MSAAIMKKMIFLVVLMAASGLSAERVDVYANSFQSGATLELDTASAKKGKTVFADGFALVPEIAR